MDKVETKVLNQMCQRFRMDVINTLYDRQTGHPGGSLSVCEILATLYFRQMNVDSKDPEAYDRDRLILSKGHAAPMLYRILAEKGFFPADEMKTLRTLNTRLQGHPCAQDLPGVDASTGPLGLGLSCGIGMALGLKKSGSKARVYVVLGDGETNEGTVWEGCMSASKFGTDNLCAILDWNNVQLDGTTEEVMPQRDIKAKFEAFGWQTIECDGHDVDELDKAFETAKTIKGKPTVVLAHTIKGKGVSFMEGDHKWHGKAMGKEDHERAMKELGGME